MFDCLVLRNKMELDESANPPFDDLIKEGIVEDEHGTIETLVPMIKALSIKDVRYVHSGRGLYRAWISNLQKAIRRGMVKDALRSAYECGSMGGCFLSNTVNRVCKVIVSEDVGPANNDLVIAASTFLETYSGQPWEDIAEHLFKVIIIACTGYKSRVTESLHFVDLHNTTYTSFETAFTGLKESVKTRHWHGAMQALHACLVVFGGEKYVFSRTLPVECKPTRMNLSRYRVWNWLCHSSRFAQPYVEYAVKVNVALYKIWYSHKGDENFINAVHALANVMLQQEVFLWTTPIRPRYQQTHTLEEVGTWSDIYPMSAAYDKHVSRWNHAPRNSINWFYRYGARVDKLHPHLRTIDLHYYNLACK